MLEVAVRYLEETVRPLAQDIDRNPEVLRVALQGMCDLELMALKRPEAYGGPAISEEDFRVFQQEVARTSGALAFLQTQHQSAVSMLAKSDNEALKQEYLPKMADGRRLVGIGFSQLRRPGPPIMKAEACDGGYLLNGSVPWITGWSFYPEFLIGATLPDGQAVFAIVPLEDSQTEDHNGSARFSPPMELAAMETAMTVSGEFISWFVPEERVAFIKPSGWIQGNDTINIALQGHFAIGCAQAGLDILKAAAEKKNLDFLRTAHDELAEELERCKAETTQAQAALGQDDVATDASTMEWRLKVRAWAIDLAVRCAHAAVTASSGAANSVNHPAQRVYREALVYTVSAQTTAIMEATLQRLLGRAV